MPECLSTASVSQAVPDASKVRSDRPSAYRAYDQAGDQCRHVEDLPRGRNEQERSWPIQDIRAQAAARPDEIPYDHLMRRSGAKQR
jgi:hypothetical protein